MTIPTVLKKPCVMMAGPTSRNPNVMRARRRDGELKSFLGNGVWALAALQPLLESGCHRFFKK